MKRTLLFITCVLTSITMWAQEDSNDYIPFVELGKQWHVVSNPTHPYVPCTYERFEMSEEVECDGKTYVHIYRINDEQGKSEEVGLFREEGRRVYKYEGGRDVMMYDFSLKEGDTFTYKIETGSQVNCKVLKLGWLEDGPQIQMLDSLTSEGAWTFKYRKLRTWTIGFDNGSGDYKEAMTWIEGIGTLRNMFYRPGHYGIMSCLAYIFRETGPGDNDYLPFPLYNMYGPVYGCELPKKGVADYSEDWHEQFSYELEGDRLHVLGNLVLNCGGYYYAYFTEERTDDPMIRKLHFRIEELGQLTTCMSHYTTDFYVSGFNPNLNYIVVDNIGEEHPVINKTQQDEYRPFVEEGKVWIVSGNGISPDGYEMEPWIDYCYFDGDTIVDGQTCKRMMCVMNANEENWVDGVFTPADCPQYYIGAWYEEDKKVYFAGNGNDHFELFYDFTLSSLDTMPIPDGSNSVVYKWTGVFPGFKGTYYTFGQERWYEGVGSDSWPYFNHPCYIVGDVGGVLLACLVGDEIIYLNEDYEYGAALDYIAGARKQRIDFTHTIKEKPKTRTREEAEVSLYGKYNEKLLSINLNPIDEAYMVSITDESGKVVYENPINAGSIVGLNIDISKYPKGNYTVTVENGNESFTGEFKAQLTGIEAIRSKKIEAKGYIYNLQGQRLSSLQKGLNIVNGKKVYIK